MTVLAPDDALQAFKSSPASRVAETATEVAPIAVKTTAWGAEVIAMIKATNNLNGSVPRAALDTDLLDEDAGRSVEQRRTAAATVRGDGR
ncbi:hypothetical protein [Nonomuraea zeae]|uniref:Uncharacterized protein n=1 Tax=Nonomuraea zeae TaxID=1642303 RepID=A0A5S4FLK3_9ACTN|nr:hypothetical protein [Nonomuraea zeae]TMR21607.1 hypothetical protein ETD85_50655 [Nonomuraea zeae]